MTDQITAEKKVDSHFFCNCKAIEIPIPSELPVKQVNTRKSLFKSVSMPVEQTSAGHW